MLPNFAVRRLALQTGSTRPKRLLFHVLRELWRIRGFEFDICLSSTQEGPRHALERLTFPDFLVAT